MGYTNYWDQLKFTKIPNTLINISGDTFYNCNNLEKVNIPKNVKHMGNFVN